jgi:hypothetical protein
MAIKGINKIAEKLESLKDPFKKNEWQEIGDEMVDQMKKLIAGGTSTVRSGEFSARMPGYKRANDKDGYPNTVKKQFPNKDKRPVNLFLSGKMLAALKAIGLKQGVQIQYSTDSADKKESGHRAGVNTQPKRPTIPFTKQGEDFAASIRKIFDTALRKRYRELLKK